MIGYAPLESPIFTEFPEAPTPSFSDSSKLIATTEFVYDVLQRNDLTIGNGITKTDMNCVTTFKDAVSINADCDIGKEDVSSSLNIYSRAYIPNGVFKKVFYYNSITEDDYPNWLGNIIIFENFVNEPTTTQLLPTVTSTNFNLKSTTITIYNRTPYDIQLSTNGVPTVGLLIVGTTSITLKKYHGYEFTMVNINETITPPTLHSLKWYVTLYNFLYTENVTANGGTQTIDGAKTFSTHITTPYISFSSPIYIELQGDYTERLGLYYNVDSYEATYNSVGDIFGYSANNNNLQQDGITYDDILRVFKGCFVSKSISGFTTSETVGWNGANFYAPVSGKYQIHITFYIKSNSTGNKFKLQYFNVNNILIDSQYCLVETGISTDRVRTFSTILNMTVGGYFNITLTERVGSTTLYFYKSEYTNMKIMLLG